MSETQKLTPQQIERASISETNSQSKDISTKNLDQLTKSLKLSPTKEKVDFAVDYLIKLLKIEAKYAWLKENLKKDVRTFIEASFWDRLYKHLWEFNLSKFDVDWKTWIDSVEEENYSQSISKSINQIIELWWLDKFSKIHSESDSKDWLLNFDKYLADKVNISQFWKDWWKNIIDWAFQKSIWLTESDYKALADKKFEISSKDSWGELVMLLAKEIPNWLEDALRFFSNIPSWVILLPRYSWYRALSLDDNMSKDSKIEAEIKKEELVRENPALWLCELLWEKWVDAIKQMAAMLTSWKVWDISTLAWVIIWMVWWGLWLAKLWVNATRKWLVQQARSVWREWREAWKAWSSADTRNNLRNTATVIWWAQAVAQNADKFMSWWVWGSAWSKEKKAEKAWDVIKDWTKIEKRTIVEWRKADKWSAEELNKNIKTEALAKWVSEDAVRLEKIFAEFPDLKKIINTPDLEQKLIDIHNIWDATVWNYSVKDLWLKLRWLKELNIPEDIAKNLIKKWYLWNVEEFWADFLTKSETLQSVINKKWWILNYLDTLSWKDIDIPTLSKVIESDTKRFLWNPAELKSFLDLYDIKPPNDDIIKQAEKWYKSLFLDNLIKNPETIKLSNISDMLTWWDYELLNKVLWKFLEWWDRTEIGSFLEKYSNGVDKIDLSKIEPEIFEKLLNIKLDGDIWPKLSNFITKLNIKSLTREQAIILKQFIEQPDNKLLGLDLKTSKLSELDMAIDALKPENRVKAFLSWNDPDWVIEKALATYNSPEKIYLNSLMDRSLHDYDTWLNNAYNLIYRWKKEFFTDISLDNFFNLWFNNLNDVQKAKLLPLIQEWWELTKWWELIEKWKYYDVIKNYRWYKEILDIAKIAQKKVSREADQIYK